MAYRPAQMRSLNGEENEEPSSQLWNYLLYGTCGALAPIILVLVLKIFGLAGAN